MSLIPTNRHFTASKKKKKKDKILTSECFAADKDNCRSMHQQNKMKGNKEKIESLN